MGVSAVMHRDAVRYTKSIATSTHRLDQRSFEHETQQRQDRVQLVEFRVYTNLSVLDPGQQLGQDGQIEDERSREQRIFTFVGDEHGVSTTHSELGVVLVHCPLGVADGWDVPVWPRSSTISHSENRLNRGEKSVKNSLDHDKMIGVLSLLVNDTSLGGQLGGCRHRTSNKHNRLLRARAGVVHSPFL
jgi:hypothetical protein